MLDGRLPNCTKIVLLSGDEIEPDMTSVSHNASVYVRVFVRCTRALFIKLYFHLNVEPNVSKYHRVRIITHIF